MINIVILISGRGSNMVAIARACRDERWPARIVAVICSRPDAEGLRAARELGLATEVLDARGWADRAAFDDALAQRIDALDADLVVLAGYMRILGDAFVKRYAGRLLNIHPSLLPAFAGMHTHRRALAAGVRVHGATVHLVTAELDGGPIVAQASVPVLAGDDEDSLAARVLQAEHRLYPMAIRLWVEGRLALEDGRVRLRGATADDASLLLQASGAGP
jgi:phosphoribosylglycinamide formyltransferase-1